MFKQVSLILNGGKVSENELCGHKLFTKKQTHFRVSNNLSSCSWTSVIIRLKTLKKVES